MLTPTPHDKEKTVWLEGSCWNCGFAKDKPFPAVEDGLSRWDSLFSCKSPNLNRYHENRWQRLTSSMTCCIFPLHGDFFSCFLLVLY